MRGGGGAGARGQVCGYHLERWRATGTDKSDFSPLAAREVVLWPDADKSGRDAIQKLGHRLAGNGTGIRIKVLDVDDQREHWDIADAIAEGWSA